MKSQVLHTVWCNISGEAAGEIWNWSLFGMKGLNALCLIKFCFPAHSLSRLRWRSRRSDLVLRPWAFSQTRDVCTDCTDWLWVVDGHCYGSLFREQNHWEWQGQSSGLYNQQRFISHSAYERIDFAHHSRPPARPTKNRDSLRPW